MLLTVGLVLAQTATVLVLLVAPPPRPPVYLVSDVAAALRGGPLRSEAGLRLARSVTGSLPPSSPEPPGRAGQNARARLALAAGLGVAPERVEVEQLHPSWGLRAAMVMFRPPPFDRRFGAVAPMIQPPPHHSNPSAVTKPPPASTGSLADARGQLDAGEPVLVGDFLTALQQDKGSWLVVRSTGQAFPNDWQKRMLLWLTVSLAVVAPAGYLFGRRLTAPLAEFARAAERFGKDPAAPLLLLDGPAEIGVAARAFNEMQARLKRYVEDRTAMVGAISHDMRTPLARIRFKLERVPPELKASLANDVAQMEQMISSVLDFIRDSTAPGVRVPMDLLSVLECVVDDAATLGLDAWVSSDWNATVDGDPNALQRLFANLVDNAAKYGAVARISGRRVGDEVRVEIADRGPGLPAEELERVFQPFYRADEARNLDQGGIGLGLAVARSIAREHGGDVRLTSGREGLTAHVHLPISRSDVG